MIREVDVVLMHQGNPGGQEQVLVEVPGAEGSQVPRVLNDGDPMPSCRLPLEQLL